MHHVSPPMPERTSRRYAPTRLPLLLIALATAGCAADGESLGPEVLALESAAGVLDVRPDIMCPIGVCSAEIPAGDSIHYRVFRVGDNGRQVEVTRASWSIADTAIARVTQDGWVVGKRPGTTELMATQGPLAGTAPVTVILPRVAAVRVAGDSVLAVGASTTLSATFVDVLGGEAPGRPYWLSHNPQVASVDADGVVHVHTDGHVFISAFGPNNAAGWIGIRAGTGVPTGAGFRLADHGVGTTHACGLDGEGQAFCWGWNFFGQLGTGAPGGEREYFGTPLPVVKAPRFTRVAPGHFHSCALTAAGEAYCWGANSFGQIGHGERGGISPVPTPVTGGVRFGSLSAGGDFTCGLDTDGRAYCWGANFDGQLGNAAVGDTAAPVAVAGGIRFTALRAGLFHTCGLDAQNQPYCWGNNDLGELGTGQVGRAERAPRALRPPAQFVALETGSSSRHTCALDAAGTAYCWGKNEYGQVGDGSLETQARPVAVNTLQRFRALALGAHHTCALSEDGAPWCWGNNEYGQLGDRTLARHRTEPRPVITDMRFVSLSAANNVTCGRMVDGATYCWGANGQAVLGTGLEDRESMSSVPLPVTTP